MKRQREMRESVGGRLIRDAMFKEGVGTEVFRLWKLPVVPTSPLPVDAHLRAGKALRSEKAKVLGSTFCYESSKEVEHGRHWLYSELSTKLKIEILFNHT
jgi:hypothetical protein